MKRFSFGLALAGLLAAASTSQAAPIFSADFDSIPLGVPAPASVQIGTFNATPVNFTATNGTFDVIGVGGSYDFFGGANGHYIDLNGTGPDPGLFTFEFTLTNLAAGFYELAFDLAGTQRDNNGNTPPQGASETPTTTFQVGNAVAAFARAATDPFSTETVAFFHAGGNLTVFISELSGTPGSLEPFIGNLLDNVTISVDPDGGPAVPEPGTLALLTLGGLGFVGRAVRRRRAAV